ncbi:DUF2079 domain-containing protein [Fluviispira multicolorata]|nr:DUF2079 domain-containing protein [Fluviispira multicolorata]
MRINSVLVAVLILLYPNILDGKILKIQNKLNSYLEIFSKWIFINPWKCGVIVFFILFFSYGLKGFYLTDTGYDTGFFLQALSNPYLNGTYQLVSFENNASFFRNHFQPYLFLLFPFKYLPYPSIFLYSTAYIFLSLTLVIGIKFINSEFDFPIVQKITLLLTCLSSPFWDGLSSYEFHELALVPFFYLLIFISWYNKSIIKIIFFSLMALSLKETVAITFIFSGLLMIIFGKSFDKKAGLALFLMGSIIYMLYFKVILVSLYDKSNSYFISYYSTLGNTMLEVALSPFLKTQNWLIAMLQSKNIIYIFYVILPVILYLKGGFKALFFAFPLIYTSILASGKNLLDYKNQYGGELVIPLCICAFFGYKHLIKKNKLQNLFFNQRLLLSFSIIVFFEFLFINPVQGMKELHKNKENVKFTYELQNLPLNYVVLTNTSSVFPFVGQREKIILKEYTSEISPEQFLGVNYFIYLDNGIYKIKTPINAKIVSNYKDYYLYKID